HGVVEHDPDGASDPDERGELASEVVPAQADAAPVREPVEGDRELREAVEPEGRDRRVAGEDAEPQLDEDSTGRLGAAVPRRGEERVERLLERVGQEAPARVDVGPLARLVARGAELALPADGLVVGVRVPVLVDADERLERCELAGQAATERARDYGEVDRRRRPFEDGEQGVKPRVGPAGVVVTEEEVDRSGGVLERLADGIEPAVHAAPPEVRRSRSRAVVSAPFRSSRTRGGREASVSSSALARRLPCGGSPARTRTRPSSARRLARRCCSSSPGAAKGTTSAGTRARSRSSAAL